MAVGGDIKVVLTLDDKDFSVKTVKAGNTLQEFKRQAAGTASATKTAESAFSSFGTRAKDLVFTISILRFAFADFHDIVLALPKAFLKAGGDMERMMSLMEGLSDKTDEVARRAEALKNVQFTMNFARNAPFELTTLTDLFVKMKTGGIDPTAGGLKALTDSLAKFGATDEQAKRAGIAIQQMAGKGVVSMEELRQQLGEAVPNAMNLMARGMGMTMAQLNNAVKKGTVEATTAISKMLVQMSIDAAGASERMMKTLPGMISQLKTEWQLFAIEVSGGGAGDVIKEQLQELINFFRSETGKQFARDLGIGFRDLLKGVVSVKDALIEAWPVIKLVGAGLLYWFAGKELKQGFDSIRASILAKKQALDDLRMAQVAAANEEIRAARSQIDLNNAAINVREKMIAETLGKERAAHLEKINLAKQELTTAKQVAETKYKDAQLATARAGVLYAEAVKYERAIQQIDESGKARQGVKRQNFVDNMTAYRQETVALQTKAVAMRQEADAAVKNAEAKLAMIKADRSYAVAANSATQALQLQQTHLRNNNAALYQIIENKQKLAEKASGAGAAIMGFGRSLLGMVGWGLAVQGVGMAIAAIYDSIAGAAKRAAAEIDRLQRVRAKEGTREDVKAEETKLAEINSQIAERQRQLKAIGEGSDPRSEAERALRRAEIAKLEGQRLVISKNLEMARDAVDRNESSLVANDLLEKVNKLAVDTVMGTDTWKKLTETNAALAKAEKEGNKKLFDKLKADSKELTLDYLRAKADALKKAYDAELPNVEKKGFRTVEQFKKAYVEAQAAISGQMSTVRAENKFVVDDEAGKSGNQRENPLLKLIESQKADLARAKVDLAGLESDVKNFTQDAQNKALFTILEKMARGEFDYGTKKNPGESPGGKNREKYIEQFSQFLQDGKGGALDFLKTLEGLDGKMENSKESWRSAIAEFVRGAGPVGEAEARFKFVTQVMQQQSQVTEDLAAATAEFNAGVSYLPGPLEQLARSLAGVSAKAKQFGLDFSDMQKKMLSDKMNAELLREVLATRKKAEDEQINSITNVGDRQKAQHAANLRQIEREYQAQKDLIEKNTVDEKKRVEQLALLEEATSNKRKTENTRFAMESRSALTKLLDEWKDFGTAVDNLVAQTANNWLDAIMDFVEKGKFSLKDLVRSFLVDLARIQLKKTLEPMFAEVGAALSKVLKDSMGGAGGGGFLSTIASFFGFEKGGVMTKNGPLPLKAYQSGGIADRPQLALFGEGSMNEAYVPLPDGKRIPVDMQGQGGGATPNVTVNVINQSGQQVNAKQGNTRFDGRQMILDVVLTAASQPGPFRDNLKSIVSN